MEPINLRPIGMVHSPYKTPQAAPIQGYMEPQVEATVEIYPEFAPALKDLAGFSHIIMIYYLHRSKPWQPLVKPFLDNKLRGVFATRAPARPNPIGLSVVRLLGIEDNLLRIAEVDMLDSTPVLDIKPYVTDFDERKDVRLGWYAEVAAEKKKHCRADKRFTCNKAKRT